MYKIIKLSDFFDRYKDIIIKIYLEEWGWHYSDEWEITDYTSMLEEILKYKDTIYILSNDEKFIGTVALMDSDIKMYSYNNWMTCLYVKNEYRKMGYGKILIEYIQEIVKEKLNTSCYLWCWCYTTNEKIYYEKCNFKLVENFQYNSKNCYLMKF
jgi:N-acetylglutamate synthase-like GNAT family acetyltransferase